MIDPHPLGPLSRARERGNSFSERRGEGHAPRAPTAARAGPCAATAAKAGPRAPAARLRGEPFSWEEEARGRPRSEAAWLPRRRGERRAWPAGCPARRRRGCGGQRAPARGWPRAAPRWLLSQVAVGDAGEELDAEGEGGLVEVVLRVVVLADDAARFVAGAEPEVATGDALQVLGDVVGAHRRLAGDDAGDATGRAGDLLDELGDGRVVDDRW